MGNNPVTDEKINYLNMAINGYSDFAVDSALQELIEAGRCYSRGRKLTSPKNIRLDAEILIEDVGADEKGAAANRDRQYYIFKKTGNTDYDDYEYELQSLTFDELLDKVEEPEEKDYQKPAEPQLHGFAWLRHKLSFLFGEPDAYREYQRGVEVYEAKKMQALEGRYGYGKFVYDRGLLDPQAASDYKERGVKPPEQKQPTITSVTNPEQTDLQNKHSRKETLELAQANTKLMRSMTAKAYVAVQCSEVCDKETLNLILSALNRNGEDPKTKQPLAPEDTDKLADYILALRENKQNTEMQELAKRIQEKKKELNASDLLQLVKHADQKDNPFHAGYAAYFNMPIVQNGPADEENKMLANEEDKEPADEEDLSRQSSSSSFY